LNAVTKARPGTLKARKRLSEKAAAPRTGAGTPARKSPAPATLARGAPAGDNIPIRTGRGRRKASPEATDERRRIILAAALEVFSRHGFAAARLDDVAAQAGVAKGTLYLYFPNKQTLFKELIRSYLSPLFERLAQDTLPDVPPHVFIAHLFEMFRTQILGTERQRILYLLISEGSRFPEIAEFYHREVVSRGIQLVQGVLRRAAQEGVPSAATLAQFPQLLVAPMLVAVIWDALFGRIHPLDVDGMLKAHARLLISSEEPKP
jgi:AcrR family transcriptional regulator